MQRFGGVDDGGLGARLLLEELGAHVDPGLKRGDEPLLRRDGLLQHVAFGGLLRALGVERGLGRGELAEVGRKDAVLAIAQGLGDVVRPIDGRRGSEGGRLRGGELRPAAQRLGPGGGKVLPRGLDVGLGLRPIEFDENVARLDQAVVGDVNGRDPARLDRLDHLDSAGRLEFALGGGDDVEAAEIRPGETDRDQRANDPQERHMHGRSRRLQNLQSRRKKLAVGEAPAARSQERERAPLGPLCGGRRRSPDGRDCAGRVVHAATSMGLV